MEKLERLLNLTAVLLDTPRPLTADELRERVEGYPPPGTAFRRTFERDKEDLRVLGIPLIVEPTVSSIDGYRIDRDDYYLADPGLDPDELAALHLASLAVPMVGMGDREALWKLGGLVEPGPVASEQLVASIPADPALAPIFDAIVGGNQIRFRYRDEERTVDPWRLDFQRGHWYLTGYDHLRSDERNFRLDRIESTVESEGPIVERPDARSRPANRPAAPWELGAEEPIVATIKVDAEQVPTAVRQLGGADPSRVFDDGAALFEVPVVNFDAFRTFLLGFLHRAELLEPVEWRELIVDWLERVETGG